MYQALPVYDKKEVYAGRASHHAGVERKTPCPGIFHHAGESFPVFRPQQLGYGKVGSLFQGAQLLCDLSLSFSLAISVSALLMMQKELG